MELIKIGITCLLYTSKYVAADLRLHSIHPSITRESKWRYIMKKINLRELYPDVYKTDHFVEVAERCV